ncbi:MAG TPA: hypothetical protein VMG31_06070 [Verrucomicrobiae bacterium]|nr:hypothetical protein [Verrucomicrobiae bacterium]
MGDAIQTAGRARELALQMHDEPLEKKLQADIGRYELEQGKSKSR